MSIGADSPQVHMLRARALIEQFKERAILHHGTAGPPERAGAALTAEMAQLCELIDREVDRRLDGDITDATCDLLEHLSEQLHGEIG